MKTELEAIVAAVAASSELHELPAPAEPAAIEKVEYGVRTRLPQELRTLYTNWNGPSLVCGNLNFFPLDGDGPLTVCGASDWLREKSWPIPEELLVIGDYGTSDLFGIWLPFASEEVCPVIEMGAIFEPGCMAIAGTSILRFVRGRLAYYLLVEEASRFALDALDVPLRFRVPQMDNKLFVDLRRWVDPAHPEPDKSCYDARHDAAAINTLLGCT